MLTQQPLSWSQPPVATEHAKGNMIINDDLFKKHFGVSIILKSYNYKKVVEYTCLA